MLRAEWLARDEEDEEAIIASINAKLDAMQAREKAAHAPHPMRSVKTADRCLQSRIIAAARRATGSSALVVSGRWSALRMRGSQ